MAILNHGNIQDVPVILQPRSGGGGKLMTAAEARKKYNDGDLGGSGEIPVVTFPESKTPMGLAFKGFTLREDFEKFLRGVFSRKNEIFYTAIAWDLSGQPPVITPMYTRSPEELILKAVVNKPLEFMGAGELLFPARKVHGYLNVRLILSESDESARNLGKLLEELHSTIRESELVKLLLAAGEKAGIALPTLDLVLHAAEKMVGLLGQVLTRNNNDHVELFGGTFPVNEPWRKGEFKESRDSAEATFTRLR